MGGVTPVFSIRFPYIDETITDVSTKNAADDMAAVLSAELDVDASLSQRRATAVAERFATQNITAGAVTTITQDNETLDTDAAINLGTQPTRITVPANMGGLYWVHGQVSTINGGAWTSGQIALAKNGVDQVRRKYWSASGSQLPRMLVTMQIVLVPTDFLTLTVLFQGTPNPSTVQDCMLSAQRLTI